MKTFLPIIFSLLISGICYSHSGDLDMWGGHVDHSGHSYHFHRDLRTNDSAMHRDLRAASRSAQKKKDYETAAMCRYLMYERENAIKYMGWALRKEKDDTKKLLLRSKLEAIKAMK